MFGNILVDCVVVDTSIAGTFYNKVDCHPIAAQGLKVYLKVWGCRGVSRPAPGGKNLPLYPLGCKACTYRAGSRSTAKNMAKNKNIIYLPGNKISRYSCTSQTGGTVRDGT